MRDMLSTCENITNLRFDVALDGRWSTCKHRSSSELFPVRPTAFGLTRGPDSNTKNYQLGRQARTVQLMRSHGARQLQHFAKKAAVQRLQPWRDFYNVWPLHVPASQGLSKAFRQVSFRDNGLCVCHIGSVQIVEIVTPFPSLPI